VGVWVGNADGTLVRNLTSASSSLLIWRDFMQVAVDYLKIPPKPFAAPDGLVKSKLTVPAASGCRTVEDLVPANLARQGGGDAGPAGTCRTVKIDTRNGLLAGPDTPPEFVQEVTYVDLPADAAGWTPGAGLQLGTPPRDVSTITPTPTPSPTPTRAPTLPPRVVTATPTPADDQNTPATQTPVATLPPRVNTATPAARPAQPTAAPTEAPAQPTAAPVATQPPPATPTARPLQASPPPTLQAR
jgi:hypothetical protein